MANYGEIKNYDIANGPGCRVSIFMSGCSRHCPGCFNQETWDPNYGKEFTKETIEEVLKLLEPDSIQGLTILGGEPLEYRNAQSVLDLVNAVRERYDNKKDIWLYTGYYINEILEKFEGEAPQLQIIVTVDAIVDGPFEQDKKDISLQFKGSSNQNILLVKKDEENKRIVFEPVNHVGPKCETYDEHKKNVSLRY